MNLGDAKRKVLRLLDEKTSLSVTQDPLAKMNDYFDMGQKEIANVIPIKKIHSITKAITAETAEFVSYAMPSDFIEPIKITGLLDGSFVDEHEKWINKTLYLRWDDEGVFSVEYEAYPTEINSATLDTYEFEIDAEAQEALLYYVAAQCEVKEFNLNYYDNFMGKYNNAIANLLNNKLTKATFVQLGGSSCLHQWT